MLMSIGSSAFHDYSVELYGAPEHLLHDGKTTSLSLAEKFNELSSQTYYQKSKYFYRGNTFPNTYKVFFENYDVIKNLKMSSNDTKEFIQLRKGQNGGVSRKLPMTIKFKIKEKIRVGELKATLTEVVIYESRNKTIAIKTFK